MEFLKWLFKHYSSLLQKHEKEFLQGYVINQKITDLKRIDRLYKQWSERVETMRFPAITVDAIVSTQPIGDYHFKFKDI